MFTVTPLYFTFFCFTLFQATLRKKMSQCLQLLLAVFLPHTLHVISFHSHRQNYSETRGIMCVHTVLLHVSQCSCFVFLHLLRKNCFCFVQIKAPIFSLQRTFFKYEALPARWHPSKPSSHKKASLVILTVSWDAPFIAHRDTRGLYSWQHREKKEKHEAECEGNRFYWGANIKRLKCGRTVASLLFFHNHFYLFISQVQRRKSRMAD